MVSYIGHRIWAVTARTHFRAIFKPKSEVRSFFFSNFFSKLNDVASRKFGDEVKAEYVLYVLKKKRPGTVKIKPHNEVSTKAILELGRCLSKNDWRWHGRYGRRGQYKYTAMHRIVTYLINLNQKFGSVVSSEFPGPFLRSWMLFVGKKGPGCNTSIKCAT